MKPPAMLCMGLLFLGCATAQEKAPATTSPPDTAKAEAVAKAIRQEMAELSTALTEGGSSPNDYIRVLEAHIAKYPNSSQMGEIDRALVKAAIEAHDDARTIKYGERVLVRDPSDVSLLDHVTHSYLVTEDAQHAEKGLGWAKKYEVEVERLRNKPAPGRLSAGQWQAELDKQKAWALVMQSRSEGILGRKAEAIALAKKSYDAYPTAEGAREWGRWLASNGDKPGAVEHIADAFTLEDPRSTEIDRAKDRRHVGELYTEAHGSEKGLGDLVLQAYDRTSGLMADRAARLKAADPNVHAAAVLDFTLPSANAQALPLASLKGKTVVLDFWATWCGPCKAQRPLYQEVEKRFKGKAEVVFLSVNTDEDRALVPPFLKSQAWTNPVYYDGGLAEYIKVNSIPTTVILDRTGQISSRMNGFIPERFVDLLTERIQDTLR